MVNARETSLHCWRTGVMPFLWRSDIIWHCKTCIIILPGNSLAPNRHQAITWANAYLLSNGPLGTNFHDIYIKIWWFSFTKLHLKMTSANDRHFFKPQCYNITKKIFFILLAAQVFCYGSRSICFINPLWHVIKDKWGGIWERKTTSHQFQHLNTAISTIHRAYSIQFIAKDLNFCKSNLLIVLQYHIM